MPSTATTGTSNSCPDSRTFRVAVEGGSGGRGAHRAGDAGDPVRQVLGGQRELDAGGLVELSAAVGQHLLGVCSSGPSQPPSELHEPASAPPRSIGRASERGPGAQAEGRGRGMRSACPHRSTAPRRCRATGPAHGRDRLAAGHARAVPPAGRPPAGRPAPRWRPRPGPGAAPAQAKTRVSSPLRKRWQRTPPVARPLAGYSRERRDLDRAGLGAGQRAWRSRRRSPRRRRRGRGRRTTPPARRSASRMPAMPPPERPWGRTPSAREVQQLGVGGDEAELLVAGHQLDRADDLVAVLEPDDLPLVAVEHLGVDPLDDALRGCRAPARGRRRRARSAPAPARPGSRERTSLSGSAALEVGVVGRGGQLGQVEHAELQQPAAAR